MKYIIDTFKMILFRTQKKVLAPVLLSKNKKNDNGIDNNGISDDVYDRIPEKFKDLPPIQKKSSDLKDKPSLSITINNNDINKHTDDTEKPDEKKLRKPKFPKKQDQERIIRIELQNRDSKPSSNHSNDNNDGSRNDSGNEDGSKTSRTPSFSSILLILTLCLLVCILFSNFFVSGNSMDITWNGFNHLLDQKLVDTVELKGDSISGEFKDPPPLEILPQIFPNGNILYDTLLRKVAPKLKGDERVKVLVESNSGDPTLVEKYWAVYRKPIPTKKDEPRQYAPYYEIRYKVRADGDDTQKKAEDKKTGFFVNSKFTCAVPKTAFADQDLDKKIQSKVRVFTSTTPSDWTGIIMAVVSIGFMIFLLMTIFRIRRSTTDQGSYFSNFGSSPARRYTPSLQDPITFEDVAGLDNVKQELVEIVDFLKHPERYERMGARVPKGTLLFGPPGTGKTLLGRAVAGEAGVPFFSINGSEFIQMYVGVGASRVRDLFNVAKQNAPSILFIDEIDAVGRQRGTGVGGGHDEREQTLNQILSEMDGFTPNESVMVMAATNRPDVLDQALMRPGRFDRHITVDRPSLKGRLEIFEVYISKIPCSIEVDVEKLARSTVGFTGADIRNLVNEATLWATRNNKNIVEMSDFEYAHEKVVMGLKREETISEDDKKKTAYHEAGHTILGWFSPINSHVHKVTIIPRGQSLGATYFLPDEDQVSVNKIHVEAMLVRYLGGRAAERIVFEVTSSGAENDLKEATKLARRMVIHWGMSPRLGPIAFRTGESHPFLGREIAESREYSESTAQLIDEEMQRILREADQKADQILKEKRDLLDKLSNALIEEEELDQEQIEKILGPSPYPPKPIELVK